MILADGQIPFLSHLGSYLVFEKEHKTGHCHQVFCYWLFFVVSTLEQSLKKCKTFGFAVFAGISSAFKKGNWTIGRMGLPVGQDYLYRVNRLIRL